MMAPWTWGRGARAVAQLVAPGDGSWLVLDLAELGSALGRAGHKVLRATSEAKARRVDVRVASRTLPVGQSKLGALVVPAQLATSQEAGGWRSLLMTGGSLVLVGTSDRASHGKLLLASGYRDPRQQGAGRLVLTAGTRGDD